MTSLNSISGIKPDTVSASTDGVEATLNRDSNGTLFLNLEETFSDIREPLEGQSVTQAVAHIQQREIDRIHCTLTEIQQQLVSQVSHEGGAISGITRNVTTTEERNWHVAADRINIAGFTTVTEERLCKPDGVSEASLVRAGLDRIIADRIQAIRDIYQHVGRDISSHRTS